MNELLQSETTKKSHVINTVSKSNYLMRMISENFKEQFVGFAYKVDYENLCVLSNDKWKNTVNGIPLNALLIASAIDPENFAATQPEDKEIVLIRVMGTEKLPEADDHIKTVIQHYQKKQRTHEEEGKDDFDPWTKGFLQWGSFACRILGTFYINSQGQLKLGSDIENFASNSRMRVYKPTPQALDMIVNYVDPLRRHKAEQDIKKQGFKQLPPDLEVGHVRYTSARRLQEMSGIEKVPVKINSADFLAKRTACFGMTRTGKSNQIKTIVSSVKLASLKGNVPVGQLIFDLNGEYANINYQDEGSAISDVFQEDTIVYCGIDVPLGKTQIRDLRNNFYEALVPGLRTLQSLLYKESLTSADIKNFLGFELDKPDESDKRAITRWEVRRAAYLCLLYKAGFRSQQEVQVSIPAGKKVKRQIYEATLEPNDPYFSIKTIKEKEEVAEMELGNTINISLDDAIKWFEKARRANRELIKKQNSEKKNEIGIDSSTAGNAWLDSDTRSLLNLIFQKSDKDQFITGYRHFMNYRSYHSATGNDNIAAEIYRELTKGKIIIVDLSIGHPMVRENLTTQIASYILETSMQTFTSGETQSLPNILIYIEEAHNLIGKKDDLTSIWPRVAKEGAKFRIGLVYATQEPSSIHPNILSNTENWFVTHLNNDDELRVLSKYYDFADFAASLKKAQDVGFARVKTLSSAFVIPIQIKLFEPNELKQQMEIKTDSSSQENTVQVTQNGPVFFD